MVRAANTIVFLTDNHARSATGCYGNSAISTPVIDSIAAKGMRFDNAYCASPLCCPSRASIATGQFPNQTGFYDNAIVYDGSVTSWMRRARDAGRKVVSIGKLHFRSGEDDNGFSEEIIPMHILNGRGGTTMLLRAEGNEPRNVGQWELYTEQSGMGATVYQQYDRDITRATIEWLRENGDSDEPWILFVSYASPHPPFQVPPHIDAQYDQDAMPLPSAWSHDECSRHPAVAHLRDIMDTFTMDDPDMLRRVAKGYYGLITHVDRQIGEVLGELEAIDMDEPRLIYTSDHGEMLGAQGLFGKSCVYEDAIRVPLIISGPDIPQGVFNEDLVSHVDLFQTLLDSVGIAANRQDADLPGSSLLGQIPKDRRLFAEYHATGTTGAAFVLRQGEYKLIYYVGYPNELFNLVKDPDETCNLAGQAAYMSKLDNMVGALRGICDPEAVDRQAKAAQQAKVDEYGGREAIIQSGTLVYTPPPGKAAEVRDIV